MRHALHWRYVNPSDAVRGRLIAAHVTDKELSDTIGVGRGMARLMLRGKRGIHANHFPAIAAFLGTTQDDLIRPRGPLERVPDRQADERELVRLYRSVHEPGKQLILGLARMIVAEGVRPSTREVVQEPPDHPPAGGRQGQVPFSEFHGLRRPPSRRRKRANSDE